MTDKTKIYPGIDRDHYGGMTDIGRIIRDSWLFGIIPETETCAGWNYGRIELLYDKVHAEWLKYGYQAGRLPPELKERHGRIYAAAIAIAREQGWSVHLDDES